MIAFRKALYYIAMILFTLGSFYYFYYVILKVIKWNECSSEAYAVIFNYIYLLFIFLVIVNLIITFNALVSIIYPFPSIIDIKRTFLKWEKAKNENPDYKFNPLVYGDILGDVKLISIEYTKMKTWLIIFTIINFFEEIN